VSHVDRLWPLLAALVLPPEALFLPQSGRSKFGGGGGLMCKSTNCHFGVGIVVCQQYP